MNPELKEQIPGSGVFPSKEGFFRICPIAKRGLPPPFAFPPRIRARRPRSAILQFDTLFQ